MRLNLNSMLTVDRVIAAPQHAVWDVLVDVGQWPRWGPSVTGARLDAPADGLRLGATGRVHTPLGIPVPFVITEFDAGRHWAWAVAGVPATRHGVTAVPGGSRLTFAVPWWAAPYCAICAIALRRIERIVIDLESGRHGG
jgi:uncharacterized protein YndB with AHSA1/START domain